MGDFLIYSGIAALAAYLLGSLNGALLMSKALMGDDIRKHGSGNAGATNVLRTYGAKWTVIVSLWDIAKGVLAVLLANHLLPNKYFGGEILAGGLIVGFFVAVGHIFPVFFGFKGGKGVLTSCAVFFAIDPVVASISLGFFFIIVVITRYISLGSVCAVAILPALGWLFGRGVPAIAMYASVGLLIIILHRANIKRLLNGTESKFSKKK
jgi:glycerol-3-phosphate acyltransferase PlsY